MNRKCPYCNIPMEDDGEYTMWCDECGYRWVSNDPEPFDIGEVN